MRSIFLVISALLLGAFPVSAQTYGNARLSISRDEFTGNNTYEVTVAGDRGSKLRWYCATETWLKLDIEFGERLSLRPIISVFYRLDNAGILRFPSQPVSSTVVEPAVGPGTNADDLAREFMPANTAMLRVYHDGNPVGDNITRTFNLAGLTKAMSYLPCANDGSV